MSESKLILTILKGHLSELPPEQLEQVHEARDRIKAIYAESDMAQIGFALATAEITVEEGR